MHLLNPLKCICTVTGPLGESKFVVIQNMTQQKIISQRFHVSSNAYFPATPSHFFLLTLRDLFGRPVQPQLRFFLERANMERNFEFDPYIALPVVTGEIHLTF